MIVVRRLPESLPSRRRCFFASSLVEPFTRCGSLLGSFGGRGVLTLTTTFGESGFTSIGSPARRRERRRRCDSDSASLDFLAGLFLRDSTGGRSGALKIRDVALSAGAAFTASDFLVLPAS